VKKMVAGIRCTKIGFTDYAPSHMPSPLLGECHLVPDCFLVRVHWRKEQISYNIG